MKNRRMLAVLLTGLALLMLATPIFAAKTSITGIIINDGTLQAQDGTVYFIAPDDMGQTVMVYVGKTVQINGKVKTKEDKNILTVDEFKVMK
jgi:prefoldin subunit 5